MSHRKTHEYLPAGVFLKIQRDKCRHYYCPSGWTPIDNYWKKCSGKCDLYECCYEGEQTVVLCKRLFIINSHGQVVKIEYA